MSAEIFNEYNDKIEKAIKVLHNEMAGLRTGRASAALLEPVTVNAYGNNMPISQVGTVSTPEPRLITVQIWDSGMVKAVEKAIKEANLGINPVIEGNLIRLSLPLMTEERRKELVKIVHKYAEQSKIAIRNIRQDARDKIKNMEKNKLITEDEVKKLNDELQSIIEKTNKKIDEIAEKKEKEILTT